MSGIGIIKHLLVNSGSLNSTVPANRIYSGVIPQKVRLPAISIMQISGVQSNTIAMDSDSYTQRDRIQVSVFAKTYQEVKKILPLVKSACPISIGSVGDFNCNGIYPDGVGPDMESHKGQYQMQSHDFIVIYKS